MEHDTPRMLAHTLLRLRRREKISQATFAKATGYQNTTISAYENREISLSYKLLDYYQVYFGVPNGVVLCISHVAAMTRDVTCLRKGKKRSDELEKLRLMGLYLKNLSERILAPGQRCNLEKWKGISSVPDASWDKLVTDLIVATQDGLDPKKSTVFKDHAKLRRWVSEAKNVEAAAQAAKKTPKKPRKKRSRANRT